MENKRALPRLPGAELKRSLTVRFLLVPVGAMHLSGYLEPDTIYVDIS